ncbi:hypothetical protein HXY33_05080 [Candidatus Bathyarchaeota archaeon]|nr:hypothetical protein [Candidatus Bathyarchaeota archaeon]
MKFTQVIGLKNRLEEKIKALEKEKAMLLEEAAQLKEVVALNEKAKGLEDEVNELKTEVKMLRDKIPRKLFQDTIEADSLAEESEEENFDEECENCQEKESF